MKVYILFERVGFGCEVKYVSTSQLKATLAAKKHYKMSETECELFIKYGSITLGNPNPNSDDPFVNISLQEVKTDKIINNLK